MIVKTTKEIKGVVYDYTNSDSDMMIERNGEMYSEAVDPIDSGRVYSETKKPIVRSSGIIEEMEVEYEQP